MKPLRGSIHFYSNGTYCGTVKLTIPALALGKMTAAGIRIFRIGKVISCETKQQVTAMRRILKRYAKEGR